LIERAADIKDEWLEGVKTLGLTSGASAPEILIQEVVSLAHDRYGVKSVEELETVEETEHFGLPSEIVKLMKESGRA
jgi:4-hydroxy-3-methylbut-2-enyl diphosphate reductase